MPKQIDTSLSLEQLEGHEWGDPDTAPTNLVRRCILASKVPLRDLTSEHLRLLIGQQFSLPYLLPMAVSLLELNPLLAGDLYEGDLLSNLLVLDWQEPDIKGHLPRVVAIAKAAHLQMMDEATADLLQGHTLEQLGLTSEAFERIRRHAIESIQIPPWAEVVHFLEAHA